MKTAGAPSSCADEVSRSIDRIEPLAKSILIFYGQCGNAFRNMEIFCEGVKVPVTILKDDDGAPIDDCYGTVLGGRDEYRAFLIKQPGPSFVLNTMWLANWRHFMQEMQMLRDPDDVEEARTVFQYMDYRRTVGLNTGLVSDPVFQRQLKEFAAVFGLEIDNHDCTLKIVDSSYGEAKRSVLAEVAR